MLIIRYENLYLVSNEKHAIDTALRRLKLLGRDAAFRCGTIEFC